MTAREFFLWQVRSLTVRIGLGLVDRLNSSLAERHRESDEELGGILTGRAISTTEIEISGFEFFESAHRRGVIYSLGLREQYSLAERVIRLNRKSGPKPVGFFRTHLRRGLFLDQDDFSLMQEAFGNPTQIALLIRPLDPGPANAGIFTWEEGDIDRRQTNLFPFDSAALRAQGPVESIAPATRRAAPLRLPAIPIRWLAWGAATAAGALALGAVIPKLQFRPNAANHSKPAVVKAKAAVVNRNVVVEAAKADLRPAPFVAPVFVAPTPDEGSSLPPKTYEQAAIKSPPSIQKPRRKYAVAVLPPTPVIAAVAEKPAEPLPKPSLPAPSVAVAPAPEPVRLAVVRPAIIKPAVVPKPAFHVAVSVEARQSSELKRVVSHVPLFGRLAHAEGGSEFIPARPDSSIEPRVSSALASSLPGLLDVDLRLTIDKHGAVTNYEVLHGAGTQFASLALSTAGNASWEPAHEGDRSVNSDVIVHYRFQPGQ